MMQTLTQMFDYLLKAEHEIQHYLQTDDKVDLVESIPWVISSAIIWGVLDLIFRDKSKYAVSTFHSLVIAFAGAANLLIFEHNQYEYLAFYFLAGYFLADFFISKFFVLFGIRHSSPNKYCFHGQIV
jgi:hypothetical protein